MAQRRMFTKEITNSSDFIKMPSSTQALYFHLNMASDDDGFCNEVDTCMFRAKASEDDLKVLIAKRFILVYEDSSVIVIKHWRMNNLLRKDRYNETKYKDEKEQLYIKDNGSYTFNANEGKPLLNKPKQVEEITMATKWQPNGNQMATEYSIGKDSIGKSSIEQDSIDKDNKEEREEIDNVRTHEQQPLFSSLEELSVKLDDAINLSFKQELTDIEKKSLFKLKWDAQCYKLEHELTPDINEKFNNLCLMIKRIKEQAVGSDEQ